MEFLGVTGVKIVINPAPSEQAFALKNAIHSKIKIPKINSGIFNSTGNVLEKIKDMDGGEFVNILTNTMLEVDSDPKVNAALLECFVSCTYKSERITQRTFDDVNARKDYYLIVRECLKANLLPFYEGLISESKGLLSKFLQESPASQ